MAKQGKKKPKYVDGQVVYNSFIGQEMKIKGEAKWNGFDFMYSFEGTDLRCGELYLRGVPPAKKTISESIDDIPEELFKSPNAK